MLRYAKQILLADVMLFHYALVYPSQIVIRSIIKMLFCVQCLIQFYLVNPSPGASEGQKISDALLEDRTIH